LPASVTFKPLSRFSHGFPMVPVHLARTQQKIFTLTLDTQALRPLDGESHSDQLLVAFKRPSNPNYTDLTCTLPKYPLERHSHREQLRRKLSRKHLLPEQFCKALKVFTLVAFQSLEGFPMISPWFLCAL